jgi:hypothetical protein
VRDFADLGRLFSMIAELDEISLTMILKARSALYGTLSQCVADKIRDPNLLGLFLDMIGRSFPYIRDAALNEESPNGNTILNIAREYIENPTILAELDTWIAPEVRESTDFSSEDMQLPE